MTDELILQGKTVIEPNRQPRFWWLYTLLLLGGALLLGRSFYLQIWHGASFLGQAEGNRIAVQPVTAPRGLFFDMGKRQLVENIASTDVVFDPARLPTRENEAVLLEKLPSLLNITPEAVQRALELARQERRVTVVVKALPHEQVLRVEEALASIPGIRLVSSSVRKYVASEALAPVLGYTSAVTAEELQSDPQLQSFDQTGKAGVEKKYDAVLRGQHGAAYTEINAAGIPLHALGQRDSVAGADIELTINSELQEFIYDTLKTWHEQQPDALGAAVTVLDPRSGALKALVSYPSYDLNAFSQPSQRQRANNFLTDKRQPLFNRVTDGTYPPGSTIKPLLAVAALTEGVITPETTVLSSGGIRIGQWFFPDWKAGGHGTTNLSKAIAESVNTFFYLATGGDATHPGLGVERATKHLRALGWGTPTGIDIPSESVGFLPSPEWKQQTKREAWYVGDTYHLGIGQGDILVTPLQVSVATGALATSQLIQPHLVDHYTDARGRTTAPKWTRNPVPFQIAHLEAVRAGMRQTVESGSGRALQALSVPLAGKTGTAQQGGTEATDAWFTSYGPAGAPTTIVTVLLERGGEGDEAAVPLAKQIWQWLIERNQV